MHKYNKTNGGFDIQQLHDIFLYGLDEEDGVIFGRRGGYTTLFAFQLIGIAQTNLFSFEKTNNIPIWIETEKPTSWIDEIRATVRYVCQREGIPFLETPRSKFRFCICTTFFDFFRREPDEKKELEGDIIFPISDNDCCFQWYEEYDAKSSQKRVLQAAVDSVSVSGMKFKIESL